MKPPLSVGPANAVRRDEIVEEIVNSLRPWQAYLSRDEVTVAVKHELDFLFQTITVEQRLSDRKRNRDYAKKLDHTLTKVETLLKSAPSAFEWAYRSRVTSFLAQLELFRKAYSRAIAPGLGYHPNFNYQKNDCAWWAYELLSGLSKRIVSGTQEGPFQVITSLLYEAISGEKDSDIKRACDSVLRETKFR